MPEQYTYLLVDFFCLVFPLALSFHPKINFYKQWRYCVIPGLFTALFFICWDIFFTWYGVWHFNPRYVCGISFFGLPLEEYLFFLCIPYACVFTYYCIDLFCEFKNSARTTIVISWLLIAVLTAIAATSITRYYTSVTFLLSALFLLFLVIRRVTFLPAFYVAFAIILFPFFVSNGILTGCITDEPVVYYNDQYNLGIRMLTIPVEDTFYGMLLMLMNVYGFELARPRNQQEKPD